jgi:hypothetical protein
VKDVAEYLRHIKALILFMPQVVGWEVVREEAQGDAGLFRYRLNLCDGSLLEMFELFYILREQVEVRKYSFHWQDGAGNLLKRWDNAAHHSEVATHPHHVHDGTESNVLAHQPVDAETILVIVSDAVGES